MTDDELLASTEVGHRGPAPIAVTSRRPAPSRTGRREPRPKRVQVAKVVVRPAAESDLGFMQRMLYEAANNPDELWPPFEDSLHEPRNRRFWDGWMTRKGDLGVIAEASAGPIGAAWMRRMGKGERVPGDDPEVPVLVIGIERDQRGRGVGALLIGALLDRAREARVRAVDLTVSSFNEAALRLYRGNGFVEVGKYGDAVRMRIGPGVTTHGR